MTQHTPLGKPTQTWVRIFSRKHPGASADHYAQMKGCEHLAHGAFRATVRAEDIRSVMPPFQPDCEGYLVVVVKGMKDACLMAQRDELIQVFPSLAATYP